MKIKGEFAVFQDKDSFVAVAEGDFKKEFGGMIKLNETGLLLWKKLSGGATEEELCAELCREYDIAEDVALADVKNFVSGLAEAGFIVE